MEHVRRMEGVVYRFFSFCMVAFSKYMAFMPFGHFDIFLGSASGFLSTYIYID